MKEWCFFNSREASIHQRALQGNKSMASPFWFLQMTRFPDQLKVSETYCENQVQKFLNDILAQIKDWLAQGRVKKLVVVLNSVETREVLERSVIIILENLKWCDVVFHRWEFRIESEKVDGKVVEEAVKEEKKIRAEIRDVIRCGTQIFPYNLTLSTSGK